MEQTHLHSKVLDVWSYPPYPCLPRIYSQGEGDFVATTPLGTTSDPISCLLSGYFTFLTKQGPCSASF